MGNAGMNYLSRRFRKLFRGGTAIRIGKGIILIVIVAIVVCVYLFAVKYTVIFTITDENGIPISSQPMVLIYPYSEDLSIPELIWKQQNDSLVVCYTPYTSGRFNESAEFAWEKAVPGTYWVLANDSLQKVQISAGLQKRLHLSLKAVPDLHTVIVTLKKKNGDPRANHGWAFKKNGLGEEAMYLVPSLRRTDSNGSFIWEGVPPGNHLILTSDYSSRSYEFNIIVYPNSADTLYFEASY